MDKDTNEEEELMGLFSWLFNKDTTEDQITLTNQNDLPEKCRELLELKDYIDELLKRNEYIARKDYFSFVRSYDSTIEYFDVLFDSGSIKNYCKENGISLITVRETCQQYRDIIHLVELHNENYMVDIMMREKEYLDNILKDVDPDIMLDEEQRKVVLNDEDYCLVVAGAGAGKTTTVAAKVRYLVDKKGIDPSQILVISFTNKAVQELKDKINTDLKIDCQIATFHSTGYTILSKQSDEQMRIADSSKLYYVIQDYFKGNLLKDESMVKNMIMFFASYFDAPYNEKDLNTFFNRVAKANFATLKSDLDEYERQIMDKRSKKMVTIQNEFLRSNQEVEIANFLYLHNIDYDYEPIYRYKIELARKPYTPDFIITQGEKTAYIEHFGITEDGKNSRYSEAQLEQYKYAMEHKKKIHEQHGTVLISTYSAYNDKRSLQEHLQEELLKHGFELSKRSEKEVLEKIIYSEESRYIRKLVTLICRFITNFKTNGFAVEQFEEMKSRTNNVRTKLFLNICYKCYLEYESYLEENHAIDFEDMINDSARMLREAKDNAQVLDYKYVIVDEYQDISRQRFDLVKALTDVCDAKIIAVGDDWQSIYAFSGSDITLFTKFAEKMGYASLLKITKTYRNSQEVIDIAGTFIQQNKTQIQKELKSPKNITNPVIIYTYDGTRKGKDEDNRSGANYALAHAIETALEQIIEYNKQEKKPANSSILLLGRFSFDGYHLENSGLFEFTSKNGKLKSVKYPFLNITFMTAHASKGLGYDNVIVVNGRNETYGFPSKIEDDPVLSFVVKEDRSVEYAEERRLFYVAMTRTKNRVFFIAPEKNPSEFLLEIKRDYPNVVLQGDWSEEPPTGMGSKKQCPICGYPMQLRYKNAYGLRLYICSNEPEVCSFMTNNISAGKMSILKCDKCQDGYLIAKKSNEGSLFLGCTNYQSNNKGCNHTISQKKYYEMMKYDVAELTKQKAETTIVSKTNAVKMQAPKAKTEPQRVFLKSANIAELYYRNIKVDEIIHIALSALQHVSERKYYGVHMLADILDGSQSKRIIDGGLDKIPEYGKLSVLTKQELIVLINWLIQQHYILQTKERYPVLHPTYEGQYYSETLTVAMIKDLVKYLQKGV